MTVGNVHVFSAQPDSTVDTGSYSDTVVVSHQVAMECHGLSANSALLLTMTRVSLSTYPLCTELPKPHKCRPRCRQEEEEVTVWSFASAHARGCVPNTVVGLLFVEAMPSLSCSRSRVACCESAAEPKIQDYVDTKKTGSMVLRITQNWRLCTRACGGDVEFIRIGCEWHFGQREASTISCLMLTLRRQAI